MIRRAKKNRTARFFLTPLKSKISGQAHFSFLNTGKGITKSALVLCKTVPIKHFCDTLAVFYIRQKNQNQLEALHAKWKGVIGGKTANDLL